MELWIRSQDRECLMKANRVDIDGIDIICYDNDYHCNGTYIGKYKTKERTLEVLDEVAVLIKNKYIVKPTTGIISTNEIANEHKRLNYLYSGEFIMENPPFEIKPINNDIVYYEMPKE